MSTRTPKFFRQHCSRNAIWTTLFPTRYASTLGGCTLSTPRFESSLTWI